MFANNLGNNVLLACRGVGGGLLSSDERMRVVVLCLSLCLYHSICS